MPTFSVVAFDRIFEPTTSNNTNNKGNKNNGCVPAKSDGLQKENDPLKKRKNSSRAAISPALYATPQTTPLPDYPTSFNPSPYVVDHKRRAPCAMKNACEAKGFEPMTKAEQNEGKGKNDVNNGVSKCEETFVDSAGRKFAENTQIEGTNLSMTEGLGSGESVPNGGHEFGCTNSGLGFGDATVSFNNGIKEESDCDDFLEAEDWKSVASSSDAESRSRRSYNYSNQTSQSEFFDAVDDIYPEDVGSQTSESFNIMMQSELNCLKDNLSIEIERRKAVEESLTHMKNQWQEMAKKFSSVGLSFPFIQIDSAYQAVEEDTVDEICRQLVVARCVAGAIGRGSARAELEQEMEAIIEGKNREIARLRDKLQYYEVVNHEMSQRNQEAIEIARRRRRTQKKRQRWLWGSLAVAITIGTTAILHYYLPETEMRIFSSPWASNADSHGTASDNAET